MARLILLTLAIISSFGQIHQVACEDDKFNIIQSFGRLGTFIKFGQTLFNEIDKMYNMLQPETTKESESDAKLERGMEKRITEQIKNVGKKLESLRVDMQNVKEEIIDKILGELPNEINLRNNMYEIYLRINQVENLYENFVYYIKNPKAFDKLTLTDFATHAVSHDLNELPNVIKTIHWMLIQMDINMGESILTILSRSTQAPLQMCKRQQSLQQILYNLFNTIALADVKGYAMMQFSHAYLQKKREGNLSSEIKLTQEQFINRLSITVKEVKKLMATASRAVWKCDNYGHKEDVTYTKLNNLFQKYIVNEADLSPSGTCVKTCHDYSKTEPFDCYIKKICAQQRICQGTLWDCEYKIDSTMWICVADKNSTRRYEYIEYGNSQRYGLKGNCKIPSTKISSWARGTVSCSYCMCTCDDYKVTNSDRYVNLRKVHSDIYLNYVVTGVRFQKVNHVLHIQLQQGQLLPGGIINQTTVHWKSIENYKVGEPLLESVGTKWEYIPRENIDYHVLEWKVKRGKNRDDTFMYRKAAVNLDDLDFSSNDPNGDYLVTGMKFSINEVMGSGYHLNLEILMMQFDFTTGQLNKNNIRSFSTFKEFNGQERLVRKTSKVELMIQNLDAPTGSGAKAVPTSQSNQFLYFTTSSLETDAGQNTHPFIDLQPVVTYPSVPLSGLGLFHKSSPGSGGFLSLKLFTYNYAPHFQLDE